MADEIITPTDTTPSPTDAAPAAVAEPAVEVTADEGTVLGGAVEEEAPATEAEADQAAPETAGAPEKYELALEGVDLDQTMIAEAEPILRELNLTNDQANTLVPVAAKLVEQASERTIQSLVEAGAAQRKEWLDAFIADPEIGGAKREETEHLAAKGLDALGFKDGHPFRKALTESGFGNHPDMIRAFRRLGELVGEDGDFVRPDAGGSTQTPLEKRLYPND